MKISAENQEYLRRLCLYNFVDDVLAGEEHIKSLKKNYMPYTAGMRALLHQIQNQEIDATAEQVEDLYSDLVARAQFPSWTETALLVMVGLVAQVVPIYNLPDRLKYLEEDCTTDGFSLVELFQRVCYHLIRYGKVTLVGDVDQEGKAFIALYDAYAEYNWKNANIRGRTDLIMCAFKESVAPNPQDLFDSSTKLHRRAYVIGQDGLAKVYESTEEEEAQVFADYIGMENRPLEYLPVVRLSAINNITETSNPPLLPLCRSTVKAYQLSGDLYSALHRSCHPQMYVTGVNVSPLSQGDPATSGRRPNNARTKGFGYTGAGTIWTLPMNATAGYAEPQGTGIGKVSEEITKQKAAALEAGAKVMDIGVESGDAREARQNDQYATLYSIIKNSAKALEQILRYIYDMTSFQENKEEETSIRFEVPSDFGRHTVDGTLAAHLLTAAERGAISFATYWEYITTGKMPERTLLEEISKMQGEDIKLKPITGMVQVAKQGKES